MDISKRNFMLFLLSTFSHKVFSCDGGGEVVKRYSEKESIGGRYVGISTEEFLKQAYGKNNWSYDENLFIKLPDIPESPRVIPIETGMKGDEVSEGYIELTIYAEEYISVLKHGEKRLIFEPGTPVKVTDVYRDTETKVFEIAKYKFHESAYPYVSTRLNLYGARKVRIFCVFTNQNKDWVRVIRQPKTMNTEYCYVSIYEKD